MDDRAPGPHDPTEPIEVPPRPPLPSSAPSHSAQRDPRDRDIPQPDPDASPQAEPEATTLPLPVIPATAPIGPVTAPWAAAAGGQAAAGPAAADAARPVPRRRRHRGVRALVVSLAVIVVLAVAAVAGWSFGNAWAKDLVVGRVTDQTRDVLGLDDTARVDVRVDEPVLPQLISGSLSRLAVAVPDAPIGGATGDVTLEATGVPTSGTGAASSASAQVRMAPDSIARLAGDLGRTVPGSLHIVGKNVAVELDPSQFLSGVSFTLTLRPSAADGELLLRPIAFEVAGVQVSADVIRARFGTLAPGILADRKVCVADRFPKGMTMSGLDVDPGALVADFTVDPRILTDSSLQKPGSCG